MLNPRKGVIEKIKMPKAGEVEEFRKTRILLDKPSKSVRINVRFDRSDHIQHR